MRRADSSMRRHGPPPLMRVLLASLIVCGGSCGVADAHEAGATRVVARFGPDGRFAIDVTTDAAALTARLAVARKEMRTPPETEAALRRALDRLCGDITLYAGVWFDSGPPAAPVQTKATCRLDDEGAATALAMRGATVSLVGDMPRDARRFRWRWDLTFTKYALTVAAGSPSQAGTGETVWLEGGDVSQPLAIDRTRPAAVPSRWATVRTYFNLGFTHIVPGGLDHILFVLGIFLLSRRVRPLLWQVSAFTLAHSMTLGLSLYGVVRLPSTIVEPLIALSIVYVAVENLVTSQLTPWRLALVFGFGLLHGMGFAGVLQELTLPTAQFLPALLAFNVGVEAGQLTVIGGATVLLGRWATNRDGYRRLVVIPASVVIAAVGLVWTIERAMG